MQKTLSKALKTRTVSTEDLGELLKFINSPENKDKYYLMNNPKEDRIGKYHILVENRNSEDPVKIKLYEKKNDRDEIVYKIRYYDIISDDSSDTIKAMQLYILQKNMEYVYSKEFKIHESTGEFKELSDLLEKVKKAKAYFSLKKFLGENKSSTSKKSLSNVIKTNKKKADK